MIVTALDRILAKAGAGFLCPKVDKTADSVIEKRYRVQKKLNMSSNRPKTTKEHFRF